MTPEVVIEDIETTGLDIENDVILELAALHIDLQTLSIRSVYWRIVHTPDILERLQLADPRVRAMHTENGLAQACLEKPGTVIRHPDVRTPAIVVENREHLDLDFNAWIAENVSGGPPIHMAGNSVAGFDLPWTRSHLPLAARHFSHRTVDARTAATLCEAWTGEVCAPPSTAHRAIQDCRMSLDILKRAQEAFGL